MLRIPKTHFTYQMMPRKEKEQSMDTLVLLRRRSKIPTEGDTKCGAESERKIIQILPHLGIHPIYNYKIQALLLMPISDCRLEPDIAVTWEALLEHDKYRGGPFHPAI